MWSGLVKGDFTHVILGPEQATTDRFFQLLRDPEFNSKIAFVAIDELHMVYQWRDFRTAFPNLYQIRGMIPRKVPWFGCTATLSKEAQDFVMKRAGFRKEGLFQGDLLFIRATINRPNIAIIMQPLEKGSIRKDFRRLDFLLSGLTNEAPHEIDKTIVFIDSKRKLIAARHYLISRAMKLNLTRSQARRLIKRYDADTQQEDQQQIYDEFSGDTSPCRIMLATVALGMGMDIRNVKRVIQYGPLTSGDPMDLWQRFGRAARDGKTQAKAYFFAPYWYFSRLGTTEVAKPIPKPRKRLPKAPPALSRLRQVAVPADTESNASTDTAGTFQHYLPPNLADQATDVSGIDDDMGPIIASGYGLFGDVTPVKWTVSDIKARQNLQEKQPHIFALVNAPCFRRFTLEFLQEPTGDHIEGATQVDKQVCCNACNRELGVLPFLPPKPNVDAAPRLNSKAWFALEELRSFLAELAEEYDELESYWAELPVSAFMYFKTQWKIAGLCADTVASMSNSELGRRVEEVLSEDNWAEDKRERFGQRLGFRAPGIRQRAAQRHQSYLADQKQSRQAKKAENQLRIRGLNIPMSTSTTQAPAPIHSNSDTLSSHIESLSIEQASTVLNTSDETLLGPAVTIMPGQVAVSRSTKRRRERTGDTPEHRR